MTTGRAALASAGGFVVVLALVLMGATRPLDHQITDGLQSIKGCGLFELSTLAGLPFAIEISILLSIVSSLALLRAGFGRWALAPWPVYATLVVELALKLLVYQPAAGPPNWAEGTCIATYPLLDVGPPNSFPSGFSARMTYFALLGLWLVRIGHWRRLYTIGAGCLLLFFAWARVYLGAHWPSDVLGGVLLGAAAAFAMFYVLGRLRPSHTARLLRSLVGIR